MELKKVTKDLDDLRKLCSRTDKAFEDKLKLANNAAKSMSDSNSKLKAEMFAMEKQMKALRNENEELEADLLKSRDSINIIKNLNVQLTDR